jgi:hypothetical protein
VKSDQEFLAGVWNHIVNLEAEERDKAAARRRHRALQIHRIAVLGGMLCVFLLAALFLLSGDRELANVSYVLTGLLLLGGYVAESRAALPHATHERKETRR